MSTKGKIIKSIAGFYEVHTGENVYRCRARGVFRALGVKPLVGDDVEIEITDTVSVPMEGNVIRLFPRRNELVRPNVANVDQALLIFAITHPAPSYNMLDRFLITMDQRNLPAILCFNKQDLATAEEIVELREAERSSSRGGRPDDSSGNAAKIETNGKVHIAASLDWQDAKERRNKRQRSLPRNEKSLRFFQDGLR